MPSDARILLLSCLFALNIFSVHAEKTNLIVNGDFEEKTNGNFPLGWSYHPLANVRLAADSHTEKNSLIIESKPDAPAWASSDQYIKGIQGRTTYRFECWVKTKGFKHAREYPTNTIRIIQRDEDGEWVMGIGLLGQELHIVKDIRLSPGDSDWKKIEAAINTDPRTTQIQIVLQMVRDVGQVFFDDMALYETDEVIGDWPKNRGDGQMFNHIARGIETPHVAWARPWAKGKVNALMLISRTGAREAAELAQRVEMDFHAVTAWSPWVLGVRDSEAKYEGISLIEKRHALMRLLREPHDLIIIANFTWSQLDEEIRLEIFRQVHKGTGLVIIFEQEQPLPYELKRLLEQPHSSGRSPVASGLPLSLMRFGYNDQYGKYFGPKAEATSLIHLLRLGKGRVVYFAWPYFEQQKGKQFGDNAYGLYGGTGTTPFIYYDGTTAHHYEYYQMLLARAVIWASQRDSNVSNPKLAEADFSTGSNVPIRIEFRSQNGKAAPNACRWLIRDRWGTVESQGADSVSWQDALGVIMLNIKPLPAGTHVVEVLLRDDSGKSHSFGALPFEIKSKQDESRIESLELERGDLRGEPLRIQVSVSGKSADSAVALLTDNFGRQIIRSKQMLNENTAHFQLALPAPLTALHRLEVRIEDGRGVPFDSAFRELALTGAPSPDFTFTMWSEGTGTYTSYLVDREFHEKYGLDSSYATNYYGWTAGYVAANGERRKFTGDDPIDNAIRPHLYTILRAGSTTPPYAIPVAYGGKSLVRKPCLTDPKYLGWFDGIMNTGLGYMGTHGIVPPFVTMGDEFILAFPKGPDVCFSPTCQEDFRKYLKREYRNLAALNGEWDASYKEWAEASPITLDDARENGQFARWVDHRLHMDEVVAGIVQRGASIARKHMPQAKVGFEGMFRSISECGYDMEAIMDEVDYLCSYSYPYRAATMRSLRKPGSIIGQFANSYKGLPAAGEWFVWELLLNHHQHLFWWRGTGLSGCLSYALQPRGTDSFIRVSENVREIKQGIAALVMNAPRVGEHVGLLYSQPSLHASKIYGDRHDNTNIQAQLFALFDDLHVGYRVIGSRQVARSEWWKENDIRVLVLPYTLAMKKETVEGVKAFCKAGGTVVADIRPGVLDGHGKALRGGALDEMFGVRHGKLGDLAKVIEGPFGAVEYDPAVTLGNGKTEMTFNDAPVWIRNRFGRGRTLLWNIKGTAYQVNFQTSDFREGSSAAYVGNEGILERMRPVLKGAKVSPVWKFPGDGQKLRGTQVAFFEKGQTTMLGLARLWLKLSPELTGFEVVPPRRYHLYDVRQGKYLGRARKFEAELPLGTAKLYAAIPYKVDGVGIIPSKLQPNGQLPLTLEIQPGGRGKRYHVIRIRVFNPKGHERPWYARNVVLEGFEVKTTIPFALNDPPGKWTIRARDVISGMEGFTKVELPGAKE